VEVVEVALRDGLQNESVLVATEDKIRICGDLAAAGARRIEAVSFAHPRLVPAMADAEAVMANLERVPGVRYSGLVLNLRGLDRAIAAEMDEINVVVCASDTFSRRNQNMSTAEATQEAMKVVTAARTAGVFATVTVAAAFGCPFEGEVEVDAVGAVIDAAVQAGADEICLADTIGVGVPAQVEALIHRTRAIAGPDAPLRFHFHNTRNSGYANAWEAVRLGVTALDSSAGGIGGCPFAPAATGNIATEDLVYLLNRSSVSTGLDLARLVEVADELSGLLGKTLPSALLKAGDFPGVLQRSQNGRNG
jgi:hydroxymethylglutaryl-CoA lyase